eukprot:jgi/Mesvir1/29614/Mv21466-RA.1
MVATQSGGDLATFKARADLAEARLAQLESAVAKLEAGGDAGGDAATLATMDDLWQLRVLLGRARVERKELQEGFDKAQEEIQRLALENQKLKYQNLHLSRSLREADEALARK